MYLIKMNLKKYKCEGWNHSQCFFTCEDQRIHESRRQSVFMMTFDFRFFYLRIDLLSESG
ncbi:hypothetical protein BO224_06430 [Erysipelotrichaceae bacterium NYU-BL-E8]|uniref:Uncharacterized protein n=1 Tax=Ileibacterium valens TaxID=1862668 RepID=A0A1U7NHH7_9FIRM|nr:hypothetical protein BM735_07010 [Erysipelotrichaceae bacterium NYU-BL-F16]OLU39993.1 hypothetical protein BO224_06430 [Erysipelotrichaceae bacterium NYU-BL-E8]OLU41269.1 hypothetical protein BO222_03585 [Ileibacterium valens]